MCASEQDEWMGRTWNGWRMNGLGPSWMDSRMRGMQLLGPGRIWSLRGQANQGVEAMDEWQASLLP